MTDHLTDQQQADIAARAEAATPGPWGFYDGDTYADVAADLTMTGHASYSYRQKIAQFEDENYWDDPAHEDHDDERASEQMAANARFVAAARTDVPVLLAEIRRLQTERDSFADRVDTLTAVAKGNKRHVQELFGELQKAQARVRELERPAIEQRRAEIRQSFTDLAAQARQDRDYEGEAEVQRRLEDREEQWAREDITP